VLIIGKTLKSVPEENTLIIAVL